jgi:hypothetical protein
MPKIKINIIAARSYSTGTTQQKYSQHHTIQPKTNAITADHLKKVLGKVDKAALHKLVSDGHIDTKDLSYKNIDAAQAE